MGAAMRLEDLQGLENPWLPPKIMGTHVRLSRSDRIFLQEMEEVRRARQKAKKKNEKGR